MHYRRLAKTDIDVSAVAFGCWAIAGGGTWGDQDESDALAALRAAYDVGVNFFDTAETYGRGRSEELVGRALASVRDDVVIATKASPSHFAPDELRAACERSLGYLVTDRIDLYQLHWPKPDTPVAETLGVLDELKAEGKIRAYGVSNFGPQNLADCLAAQGAVSSNQVAYNLLFRAVEFEIVPLCVREDISILCYSPMMQGLLTGKFGSPDDVPSGRARTRHFSSAREEVRHGEDGAEAETFEALGEIYQIAAALGQPMANVSLAWLLAQPGVTAVLAGGRTAEQAQRNAQAADLELSDDAMEELTEVTRPLRRTLGANADMWQSESRMQ